MMDKVTKEVLEERIEYAKKHNQIKDYRFYLWCLNELEKKEEEDGNRN